MNNLAYLRRELNLTQAQVAKELGVSRQAYANYESGQREPDIAMLKKMSDFFEVTIDFILGNYTKKSDDVPIYRTITSTNPALWIRDGERCTVLDDEIPDYGIFSAIRIENNGRSEIYIFRHRDTVPDEKDAVLVCEGSPAFIAKALTVNNTIIADNKILPNANVIGEVVGIHVIVYEER